MLSQEERNKNISKDFNKYTQWGGRGALWPFIASQKMTSAQEKYSEYNFLWTAKFKFLLLNKT